MDLKQIGPFFDTAALRPAKEHETRYIRKMGENEEEKGEKKENKREKGIKRKKKKKKKKRKRKEKRKTVEGRGLVVNNEGSLPGPTMGCVALLQPDHISCRVCFISSIASGFLWKLFLAYFLLGNR